MVFLTYLLLMPHGLMAILVIAALFFLVSVLPLD